jgi:hypothetical protein
MQQLTARALASYTDHSPILTQHLVVADADHEPAAAAEWVMGDMIQVPGSAKWLFNVSGIEIEGTHF